MVYCALLSSCCSCWYTIGSQQFGSTATIMTTTDEHTIFPENFEGYHEEIDGVEAIYRLEKMGERCYLARHSRRQQCYILSVCDFVPQGKELKGKTRHFKIKYSNSKIRGFQCWIFAGHKSKSIVQLLKHYESKRIHPALSNIGRCLSYDEYKKRHQQREDFEFPPIMEALSHHL